jgi:hypothetical protein
LFWGIHNIAKKRVSCGSRDVEKTLLSSTVSSTRGGRKKLSRPARRDRRQGLETDGAPGPQKGQGRKKDSAPGSRKTEIQTEPCCSRQWFAPQGSGGFQLLTTQPALHDVAGSGNRWRRAGSAPNPSSRPAGLQTAAGRASGQPAAAGTARERLRGDKQLMGGERRTDGKRSTR